MNATLVDATQVTGRMIRSNDGFLNLPIDWALNYGKAEYIDNDTKPDVPQN